MKEKKPTPEEAARQVINEVASEESFPPTAFGYLQKLALRARKGALTREIAKLRANPAHDPAKEKLLQDALEAIIRKYPNKP